MFIRFLTSLLATVLTVLVLSGCISDDAPTAPFPDYQPPEIEWLAPNSGSELAGIVTISFSVSDNEGHIDRIAVYRNGFAPDEWRISASGDSTYSLDWDSREVEDGVYILEVRAWDDAGNLGISPTLMVSVKNVTDPPEDRLPPEVWWTAPDAGSTLSDTVRLVLGFFDEVAVDSVRLIRNGALVMTYYPQGREETLEYLWDTRSDSDGVHIWEARAWDNSGNIGTSQSLLIRVSNSDDPPPEDHTPPTIIWLSPAPGDTLEGTVNLRFQVIDNTALDSVQLLLNGQLWRSMNGVNRENFYDGNVLFDTNDRADGMIIAQVRAVDISGNTNLSQVVMFTIRNNYPEVIWVPEDYETIQDAIWASEDGDTIMVSAGEYRESIQMFDKNVSLVSEEGPEETILNGTDLWVIVWLGGDQDSTTIIRGFNFLNPSEFQCYCLSMDGVGTKIVNNIFSVPNSNGYGIISGFISSQIRNNLFINLHGSGDMASSWGTFDNNMIINAVYGLWNAQGHGQPLIPNYNLFWNVNEVVVGGEMGWGNQNIDNQEPIFVEGSYRLAEGSPGIDQGRPDLRDPDSSRSDIGVYGGPYAYLNQ